MHFTRIFNADTVVLLLWKQENTIFMEVEIHGSYFRC